MKNRSDGDVAAAIAYVRAHARALGIDRGRLCTAWFSKAVASSDVRCNVV